MKIFLPASQPAPERTERANTTGRGPAKWININFLFQKTEGDETLRGQIQGEKLDVVKAAVGHELEVAEVVENTRIPGLYNVKLPGSQAPQTGSRPFSPRPSYGGPVLSVAQYIDLVSGMYTKFVANLQKALPGTSDDRVSEAAQQITIQAILAIQNNMVKIEPKNE